MPHYTQRIINLLTPYFGLMVLTGATVICTGITFLGTILLGMFVSAETFGHIRILQGYGWIVLPLIILGMELAASKLCSEDIPLAQRTARYHKILRMWWLPALGATLLLTLISPWFSPTPEIQTWLPLLVITTPFAATMLFALAYWKASRQRNTAATWQVGMRFSVVLLSTLGGIYYGVAGFAVGFAVATLLTGIGAFWFTWQTSMPKKAPELDLPARIKHVAWHSFITSILTASAFHIESVILDHFVDDAVLIGAYGLAWLFGLAVHNLIGPYWGFVLPELNAVAKNNIHFKRRTLNYQFLLMAILATICIGVYVFAYFLIPLLYTTDYHTAVNYLPLILIRVWFWGACNVLLYSLLALNLTTLFTTCLQLYAMGGIALAFLGTYLGSIDGLLWAKLVTDVLFAFGIYILWWKITNNGK